MSDDLFERLRTVDPATEERIAQETRALGNTPGRIVENEPSNVRRFPKTARRKATLMAVAAVVVVAIALPLTLLRSLGNGEQPGGGESGGGGPGGTTVSRPETWLSVGALDALRAQGGVTYVPEARTFVLAPESGEPYAVWAFLTDDRAEHEERALFCEGTGRFVASRGDVFDSRGTPIAGNAERGLVSVPVRVTEGGQVQIDVAEVVPGQADPAGPVLTGGSGSCLTAAGLPLEGRPGFAISAGTELPPIAVAMPQTGMRVTSPITIAGSADVFEATVNIRVLDANGEIVAESFAMATCGTGCRGDFSTQVEVPIHTKQPGTIQVFEYSAKDGSMINVVEIPVILVPSGS
jgi:hypothetical protein